MNKKIYIVLKGEHTTGLIAGVFTNQKVALDFKKAHAYTTLYTDTIKTKYKRKLHWWRIDIGIAGSNIEHVSAITRDDMKSYYNPYKNCFMIRRSDVFKNELKMEFILKADGCDTAILFAKKLLEEILESYDSFHSNIAALDEYGFGNWYNYKTKRQITI